MFSILWEWRYINNSIDVDSLIPLCPKCKRQMKLTYHDFHHRGGFYMQCPNCKFSTETINDEYRQFTDDVIREIEGRIRSSEYEESLKKQF